jgi:membrane protease YdiL (CAAX protease family)
LTKALVRVSHGKIIALVIASVLFGITHFLGGIMYVILCTIAGLFYGSAYLITGLIESSVITHFLVNVVHFIFFSYPALQHSIVK